MSFHVCPLRRTENIRRSESTSDFDVERVRQTFLDNPRRSVRSAARELDMPISTLYKVIKKQLRLHAYKVQIVQGLEPDDRPRRMAFATDMVGRIEDDADFLKHIMFSDEASFHVSGIVNRHNVRIYGDLKTPMNTVRHKGIPQRLMCGVD
ncbi:uncharacterized protein [Parasteatoda tepidariorum]|uniref:uncharacterized protein n=1 Tax=Parasteatoda tepidariorum TaxID=114398 RepID=UPI0039BCBD57